MSKTDPKYLVMRTTHMFAMTVTEPVFVFDNRVDARVYADTMNLKAKASSRARYKKRYVVKRVPVGPTNRKKK